MYHHEEAERGISGFMICGPTTVTQHESIINGELLTAITVKSHSLLQVYCNDYSLQSKPRKFMDRALSEVDGLEILKQHVAL
jgi:hypothetical protein